MKKFFKRTALIFLSAITVGSAAVGLSACGAKSQSTEAPSDVAITKLPAPVDGSLPTAHTGAENLAYIAGVLAKQDMYHCYTSTVTNASIATQVTKSYKDYKDGIMVSSDITYSSLVKSGTQSLFVEGDNGIETYMRSSEAPKADTNHLNAKWKQDAPTYYDEQSYLFTYGVFQTELSNYIINESTIAECSEVYVNGDGTYSQQFTFKPAESTYYYQYGMKTRGGLGSYPVFQQILMDITFDDKWQVLSLTGHEVAQVNKGVTVTSISDIDATYAYGEENFDSQHFAFYDSYFKQYVGSADLTTGGGEEEFTLDVASVLSNGFSKIMDGGQQFEITAKLGKNVYEGYVFVGLDLADPLNTLALKLSLGKTRDDLGLYVEYSDGEAKAYYGEDFALNVNLAAVKLVVDDFTEWADRLNTVFNGAVTEQLPAEEAQPTDGEASDPLADLMSAMTLTEGDGEVSLVLKTDDLLGLGIGIDASLFFGVNDRKITFRGAAVKGLSVGGSGLDIELGLSATTVQVVEREDTGTNADLAEYAADVYKLLNSDLLKVELALNGDGEKVNLSALKGLNAEVCAYVDIDGVTVGADVAVSYERNGEALSAKINAYYDYEIGSDTYGKLILTVKEINGVATRIQVCCDIKELAEAVKAALDLANVEIGGLQATDNLSKGAIDIINGALSTDFSSLISGVYADNAKIMANVDVDTVLAMLNTDIGVRFGGCRLEYDYGEGANGGKLSAALPAIGFGLTVSGADGEIALPEDYNSLDLTDAVNAVASAYAHIKNITEAQRINFKLAEGETFITYDGLTASLAGSGEIVWAQGEGSVALDLTASLTNSYSSNVADKIALKVIYDGSGAENSPVVRLAVGGSVLDIYKEDLSGAANTLSSLSNMLDAAALSDGETSQADLLSTIFSLLSGKEWVEILNKATLTSDGKSIAIEYLSDVTASVEIGTEGNLSLDCDVAVGGLTVGANVAVGSEGASLKDSLNSALDGEKYTVYGSAQGDGFIKAVYDFAFGAIGDISFENVLGGSTYNLSLAINGDDSGIEELAGISAVANLYYTANAQESKGGLAEIDLVLSAKGVDVKANIILKNEEIFVSVPEIADYRIPNLKIKTNKDSLYSLVSDLVKTIMNEQLFANNLSLTDGEAADTATSLENLIDAFATFDLDSVIVCTQTDGVKNAALNVDALLAQLGVAAPSVGTVNAEITDGKEHKAGLTIEQNGKCWLSLTSQLCERRNYDGFDPATYIDFGKVTSVPVVDICNLLNSKNFDLSLKLDGSKCKAVPALNGLTVAANAVIGIDGLMAGVELEASYVSDGKKISANLAAYYEYVDGTYGNILLILKDVNGVAFKNANGNYDCAVSCDIKDLVDGVSALLKTANVSTGLTVGATPDTSELLSNLLQADFVSLLGGVYSNADGIGMTVDVDGLVSALGLQVNVNFGKLALAYQTGYGLSANLSDLGLSLKVTAASAAPVKPTVEALDLNNLVNVANAACGKVMEIIDNQSIGFIILENSTYITLDGITAGVEGMGEISWATDCRRIALDLAVYIKNGGEADKTAIKLIYDMAAADKPLVRLAINKVGIDIYKEDIDGVVNGFNAILNALGGNTAVQTAAVNDNAPAKSNVTDDQLIKAIFSILSDTAWVEALDNLTISSNGNSVALEYASDFIANVNISTDGDLCLGYNVNGVKGFATAGTVSVYGSSCDLAGQIEAELGDEANGYKIANSRTEGSAAFIRLAYDFLLDAVHSISVDNILGTNTYDISLDIVGGNSGIAALKDVNIYAHLYFTNNVGEEGKLTELDLDVDAKGVAVKANVVVDYQNGTRYFYINLSRVMNITLPDLKVVATDDDLYNTVETLIDAVTDTDIVSKIMNMLGGEKQQEQQAQPDATTDTAAKTTVKDLIYSLLTFDFKAAFAGGEKDGVINADIDLDSIVSQLGVSKDASLGVVNVQINRNTHSMRTSVKTQGTDGQDKCWLALSSYLADRRDYSKFDKTKYVNVGFLPTLINDAVKLATDAQGKMYDSFTFSGTVTAKIISLIEIKIDISTLTLGFDKDGEFYFSLIGKLSGSAVTDNTIGLTFYKGYLTIAKDLNKAEPLYRIMTLDYFIDHMFDSNDNSPLQWLIESGVWNLVAGPLSKNVDLSSGIEKTKDLYLYSNTSEEAGKVVSMYDYVKALQVVINGKDMTSFGTFSVLNKTISGDKASNNYAFELDANRITGGILTELCAAITRSDSEGINGIYAYGAIQSYVSFNIGLSYERGLTEEDAYKPGTELEAGVLAPSLFELAMEKAVTQVESVDFNHNVKYEDKGYNELFGSYNTENASTDYSHELYTHSLKVVKLDGTTVEYEVRHGSTVYLYDNEQPVYTDEAKTERLVYSSDKAGLNFLGKSFVIDSDTTIYETAKKVVTFNVYNNGNLFKEFNSFVGDTMPTSFDGYETIEALHYANGNPVEAGTIVAAEHNGINLHGLFVHTVVELDGVVYTFDAAKRQYAVTGKGNMFEAHDYYGSETLVLKNEIEGFKVTSIAAGALLNGDDKDEKSIKNVIVPANIVYVGEKAFANNYGIKTVVFLADEVVFAGKDGGDQTMPFYGCSRSSSSDNKQNEVTDLAVYYNKITASGGDWRHFRYIYNGWWFNFYIGENGGGAFGKDTWSYNDVKVVGDSVTELDVNAEVAKYVVNGIRNSAFTQVNAAELETTLSQLLEGFKGDDGLSKYIVKVGTQKVDGVTEITVSVSLNLPVPVKVSSSQAFSYTMGSSVQHMDAGNGTLNVVKTADGVQLYTPVADNALYVFTGWTESVVDGETVYTANWRERTEYDFKIVLEGKAAARSMLHVDCGAESKTAKAKMSTDASITVKLYEGEVTFTLENNILTVSDGVHTYSIYANEIVGINTEKYENKRGISSDVTDGTHTVSGNMTVNLSY